MENLTRYPWLIFVAAFAALWLASVMGSWLRRRNSSAEDEQREDLGIILGATLTLLALIIGFSISMASSRYDQRKNLEEAKANAIGTEMLRADLLPPADAAHVRSLLGAYLDQRILFYINRDATRQPQIDQSTSQLQTDLWVAVRGPAAAQQTPVMALVLAGMNDVINSQGYTQAECGGSRWPSHFVLTCCSAFGLGMVKPRENSLSCCRFLVAIAFLLIADIDAPRRGLIHVRPQNLEALAKSFGR